MERNKETEPLDSFEFKVYATKGIIEKAAYAADGSHITACNKDIARLLSENDEEVSRNAVARARKRVAHKLQLKPGW